MPKFACKLSVEVVLALLMGLLLLIRNQEKYFKGAVDLGPTLDRINNSGMFPHKMMGQYLKIKI